MMWRSGMCPFHVLGRWRRTGGREAMKPVQVHRVLKERVIAETSEPAKPLGLMPLIHHGKEFNIKAHPIIDHGVPHKSSLPNLPKIDPASTDSQNMQKRIKELEKENFKLNHHVQQAEQTMRNYRNLLSKYNINPSETAETPRNPPLPAPVPVAAPVTQSGPRSPATKSASQAEVDSLSELVRELTKNLSQSEAENKSLVKSLTDMRNKTGNVQELIARNEALQQGLRTRERKIQEIEQESTSLKVEVCQYRKRLKVLDQLEYVLDCARQLRRDVNELRPEVASEMARMGAHLLAQKQLVGQIATNQSTRRAEKEAEELSALRRRLSESEASVSALTAELQHMQARITTMATIANSSSSETVTKIEQLTGQLEHANNLVAGYETRMQAITAATQELNAVHASQVKAIKHLTHIKELKRVAKEREHLLERDRQSTEIKYLRDIQSLLVFALNTAEHSLNEVLPHVVVKLIETRERRMKQVEVLFKSKLKDVDQRSAETCAVSSTQLDVFYVKATDNEKEADGMAKVAVERLAAAISGP